MHESSNNVLIWEPYYIVYICQDGKTPLYWAAEKGLEECVKIMLQLPDIAAVVVMKDYVSLQVVVYISAKYAYIEIWGHKIFIIVCIVCTEEYIVCVCTHHIGYLHSTL